MNAPTEQRAVRLRRWLAVADNQKLVAALFSLASYAVIFLAYDSTRTALVAGVLELLSWLLFVAVWLRLLLAADDRLACLRSQRLLTLIVVTSPIAGVLTLTGTLPGIAAALRLLRIFPVFHWLVRKGSLLYATLLGIVLVLLATLGFARVEHASAGESLYWAATGITIGPQDVSATKPITQVLTVALALLGLGFFGAVIGSLAASLMQQGAQHEDDDLEQAIGDVADRVEEASEQVEVGDAALAAKLDAIMERLDRLERSLPPRA